MRLSEEESKVIFKQIVDGVAYMHDKNIIHRDLKLENVLINNDKVIKIIDFGFSTSVKGDKKVSFMCGTPHYMSPDLA